jgi:hypothetical protein
MWRPNDLEDFVAAQEAIMGQIDHAHAAASELAAYLVVGVVGQAGWHRLGGRWRRAATRRDCIGALAASI